MPDDNNNYFYNASIPAAAVFAALYGLVLATHVALAIRYRMLFLIVLLIGCVLEFEGYIFRVISIQHGDWVWAVIISQVGLITAPAFLAASEYMVIGRVISFVGNEYSFVNHTKITKLFVAFDVFAILTQAGGGAMLSGNNETISQLNTAKKILLAGLALQVITFGIFLFVAITFDIRSSRAPAIRAVQSEMKRLRGLWLAFYISGVLITARSIYRTIEFAQVDFNAGPDDPAGYLITHEWPMYVFDSIPVLISLMVLAIWHPGRFLPQKKGLRIDGTYEELPGGRRFICCGRRKPSRYPQQSSVKETSNVALQPVSA